MYAHRRLSAKSLLCLLAITMPLQVLPANPCKCAESRSSSLQTPSKSEAVRQHSCCSTKSASCCSSSVDTGPRHRCRCNQIANSSPCNCGPNCLCSLQAPEPSTPALPPVSSTRLGDEILKSQAVCCYQIVDTVLAGCSHSPNPSSSEACNTLTNLDLCATFCRFLL